jgi:hypothetical protein
MVECGMQRAWPRRIVLACVVVVVSTGVAHASRLLRVPGGVSSIGTDPARGMAYLANPGGLFSVSLQHRPRLAEAAPSLGFSAINDIDPRSGLVLSATQTIYGITIGIFDPGSGQVRNPFPGPSTYDGITSAYYNYVGALFVDGNVAVFTSLCGYSYAPSFSYICSDALTTFATDGTKLATVPLDIPDESASDAFAPSCAARSTDGRFLVAADPNRRLVVALRSSDGQRAGIYPSGGQPCPITIAENGPDSATAAIIVGNDASDAGNLPKGSLLRLDLGQPRAVPDFLETRDTVMVGAAADPKHHRVYAVARKLRRKNKQRGTIKHSVLVTVDATRWRVTRTTRLPKRLGVVRSIAITPDGRFLLVGGETGVLVRRAQ